MSLTRLTITTTDPRRLLPAWEALGDVPVAAGIEADGTIVLSVDLGVGDEPAADPEPVHTGTCSYCGCTDDAACDPPCSWVGPVLCSHCLDIEAQPEKAAAVVEPDPDPDPAAGAGAAPGPVCSVCGCTGECEGGCSFVTDDLCSRCDVPPLSAPEVAPPAPAFPGPLELATTCAEAVVAALAAEPDVTFSKAEIHRALGDRWTASTVAVNVDRLARECTIQRAGAGQFRSNPQGA